MKKEVTLQESLITDLRTLINEARNKSSPNCKYRNHATILAYR